MLSMRIDTMVAALVNQELVGKGREKEALHFHFDIGMASYTDKHKFEERKGLHLLYHVNPGYTYVNVFSAVTARCFTSVKEVEKWTHEVSHDVCWRDDCKVFNQLYFNMAANINAKRIAAGLQTLAPVEMTEHNSVLAGHNLFDWVGVEVTKEETEQRYLKKVRVL